MLVGNPRTGTTFLQRFLADEGFGSGMELFLMLYPSLTLQKLLRPILPLLEKISPAKYHSTDAHQTSLSARSRPTTSAVLFRYLDGFFLYGFFLSFDDEDLLPWFDPRVRDTSTARRTPGWTRSGGAAWCSTSRTATSPSCSRWRSGCRSSCERFPEAQILYMARDPLSVIPSSMSLVIGVLDRAVGFWSLPEPVRKRWLDRMYKAWVLLLQKFHEDWTGGLIDKKRVFIVRYDRMMADFEGMMEEMCRSSGTR